MTIPKGATMRADLETIKEEFEAWILVQIADLI